MKEKIFNFIREKKDLLIFVGILSVVFVSVIFIANYALSTDVPVINDGGTELPDDGGNTGPITPTTYYFTSPVSEDCITVRTFFDSNYDDAKLEKAAIFNGERFIESTGVGYAKQDNTKFTVNCMYAGVVSKVEYDELNGYTVIVNHDDNVYTKYSSLSSVSVLEGAELSEDSTIGTAGTSVIDNEAGIHVFIELLINSSYVDPTIIYGKQLTEVSSMK